MNKFFELQPEEQVEEILRVIEQNKRNRTPLTKASQPESDPFTDIYWKHREVLENSNPISIPENVRFRFIKRVIGKLIRTYTRQQVHFNQSATNFMELVLKHFRNINGKVNRLTLDLEKIALMQNDIQELKKDRQKLDTLAELLSALRSEIKSNNYEFVDRLKKTDVQLSELKSELALSNTDLIDKLDNTRQWLSGFEQKNNNLEKWLEIIDQRVLTLEEFQHRTRKEIYAELKHIAGSDNNSGSHKDEITPEVLNKEKFNLLSNQELVKVNLGCGHLPKSGYLNVDMRELEGVDIIADVRNVPFPKESIDELYLAHLIEHFTEVDMEKYILPYWYSLIKPGGKITIICPNWKAMLDGYAKGDISIDVLKEITFGSQEYEGNQHYNMFSSQSLKELLYRIGFKKVNIIEEYRVNGLCVEMEIEGVR